MNYSNKEISLHAVVDFRMSEDKVIKETTLGRIIFNDILPDGVDYIIPANDDAIKSIELIASAICINVMNDILYVFYWGEIEGYETLSPIAFLSSNLVEYAYKNNYRILDVGTSSLGSIVNNGLYKFKNNIGCSTCSKMQLIKLI